MPRTLYLVAYDICEHKRLASVTRYFQTYRVEGQKSVPEIWITPAELQAIQRDLQTLLDPEHDRLQLLALDPRTQPHCMGQAHTFNNFNGGAICIT